MKKLTLLSIIFTFILSSCSSTPNNQNAINNQAADPTESVSQPDPTDVPPASPTPEPLPTATEPPAPEPTADLRTIALGPENFICEKADLPESGSGYILPVNGDFHFDNDYLSTYFGVNKAKEVLENTSRLDGWNRSFEKINGGDDLPDSINCNFHQFQTAEGAQLFLSEYSGFNNIPEYIELGSPPDGADFGYSYHENFENPGLPDTRFYVFIFTYRNYFIQIFGGGTDGLVENTAIEYTTYSILTKLQNAPLEAP